MTSLSIRKDDKYDVISPNFIKKKSYKNIKAQKWFFFKLIF